MNRALLAADLRAAALRLARAADVYEAGDDPLDVAVVVRAQYARVGRVLIAMEGTP